MDLFDKNHVRDEKRALILRTAGRLFCSAGYRSVSIDDIGKELGLAKTIIYYYFKNKADVFCSCHDLATRLLEDAFEISRQEDPVQHLRQFIRTYVVGLIGTDSPGAVLLDVELLPQEYRDPIIARREVVHGMLLKLIEAMKDKKLIRDIDPKLVVLTMMGAINIIPKWYSSDGAWSAEMLADHHASLFIDGLILEKSP